MPRVLAAPLAILVLLLAGGLARAQTAVPPIDFQQRVLPNGLKVITALDRSTPNVTVQVWYGVGAKNDPPGRSGFAHMFEHMMFKATRDMPAEYMDRLTEDVGGMNNAFTQDDTTAFYEVIPAADLQRLLWAESERMSTLVVDKANFDSERQVVEEELRLRVENSPIGKALKAELAQAYTVHPYMVSAAGEKKDLDTITPADCQKFYDTYYRPNNAALIVVGDTDEAAVKSLAEKYFGPLQKGPPVVHDAPKEPPQTAERDKTLEMPVQLPVIIGGYHIPAGDSPDLFPLEVLQKILSGGESSRLHQRLVRKDKTAVAAGGFVFAHEDPGLFLTFALYLPNMDVEKLKSALDEEIARVTTTKVDARELQKAKNQLAAQAVYQRERVSGLASNIGVDWVVTHVPARPFTSAAKFDAVTADDVLRVAKKYLVKTNLSMLTLVPAKPAAGKGAK